MSRAQLTVLSAALALVTVAPRLAAQDTSSAGQARPDTSGYYGGVGVDTSAQSGRFGMTDSIAVNSTADSTSSQLLPSRGTTDTSGLRALYPDTTIAPTRSGSPLPAPAAGDSGSPGALPAGQPRDSV